MTERPFNALFLCTGNSARSIIAEAILNKLGAERFRAYSAGSQPKGQVNPHTIALLDGLGYDTSGFRSKSWSEFARPGAPRARFRVHRLRQRRGRNLPGVAGPADDRALGRARSGGSAKARGRDRARVQGRLPHAASAHRDLHGAADPQPRPAQPASAVERDRADGRRNREGRNRPDASHSRDASPPRRSARRSCSPLCRLRHHGAAAVRRKRRAGAALATRLPTGAIFVVLILIFGPVSGAHFNPAVSARLRIAPRAALAGRRSLHRSADRGRRRRCCGSRT